MSINKEERKIIVNLEVEKARRLLAKKGPKSAKNGIKKDP
jgi:hypothetical protein